MATEPGSPAKPPVRRRLHLSPGTMSAVALVYLVAAGVWALAAIVEAGHRTFYLILALAFLALPVTWWVAERRRAGSA